MKTLFLALGVLCANMIIYVSEAHQYYFIVSHLYYGVILLCVIYDSPRNQNLLLVLTTVANWVYALQHPKQIESFAVAFLYPLVAYVFVKTIRQLKIQRLDRVKEIDRVSSEKSTLEKRVRDLSIVFEVSQAANAALELEELFHRIIEILSERLGIYRGTLNLYENGQVVKSVNAVLGLTEAEQKRGTDHQLKEFENRSCQMAKPKVFRATESLAPQLNFFRLTLLYQKTISPFGYYPYSLKKKLSAH